MASVRERKRKDQTPYWAVLYRHNGKQTSKSFPDAVQAGNFCKLVDVLGPDKALVEAGMAQTERPLSELTVTECVQRHIDAMSGVTPKRMATCRRWLKNDIAPSIGVLPLSKLTRADVAGWINDMHEAGAATGTMKGKRGFLSGVMKRAVMDGLIAANPCEGVRLPRTENREAVFLTKDELDLLKAAFSDHYRPLVEFLAVSGCRFNEAAALKPSDVDRKACTVRISRAWQQDGSTYVMGPPKTKKSNRTINVPKELLDQLDYSHEWLFTTTFGKAIKLSSWRTSVWNRSRAKAMAKDENNPDRPVLEKCPTPHDMRHTCASWLIHRRIHPRLIQEHLGHESIQTTMDRYGHLDRSSHAAIADAMAAMLSAS